MAVHTMAIKYTSQAYLEALPHLASLGAVLALVRSRPAGAEPSRSAARRLVLALRTGPGCHGGGQVHLSAGRACHPLPRLL